MPNPSAAMAAEAQDAARHEIIALLNRLFYSTLCEPSQNGLSSVVLQPHRLKVPELSAVNRTGSRPVPLWEPSQNGCRLLRPQAHHQ